MQERRTLAYLDRDDIPSSAVIATTTTTGNVLYIPQGVADFIIVAVTSADCTNLYNSSNNLIFRNITESTSSSPLSYNKRGFFSYYNRSYFYCILFPVYPTVSSNSSSTYNLSQVMSSLVLADKDLNGKYIRITFNNPVKLYSTPDNMSMYPVYINTEQ